MVEDRAKRIYTLQNVVIRDEGQDYPATVTDFSLKGISLKTEHIVPTYKTIEIVLNFEERELVLSASVRWVNEHKRDSKPRFHELGVALLNPSKDYIEYLKTITKK